MQIVHKGPGGLGSGNQGMHFPYKMVLWETIIVADGDKLALPADWECQDGWECEGSPVTIAPSNTRARSSGDIHISLSSGVLRVQKDFEGACSVDLADLSGRRIQSFSAAQRCCFFDIAGIGSGTYVVVVRSDKESRQSVIFVNRDRR